MHPHTETDIVSHLIDNFDGVRPWRGYWCLRFADTAYPGNSGNGFNYVFAMPPGADPRGHWVLGANGLQFPTYDWLSSATVQPLGTNLIIKMLKLPPPFRFELAWQWSELFADPANGITHSGFQITAPYLIGGLQVFRNASRQLALAWPFVGGLVGNITFDAGSYVDGADMRFYFQVEADLNVQWGIKVNGAVPANTAAGGEWLPDTPRATTQAWVDEMDATYPRYLPVRFYPIHGGTLRYLEARMFDHTI